MWQFEHSHHMSLYCFKSALLNNALCILLTVCVCCKEAASSPAMLLPRVLAICDEYHVRLTGEVYAELLRTQLRFCNTSDSSKPGRQFDDLLHSLKCLKAEGENWALLLHVEDRFALCAVLHKHIQHALLLQTMQPWLSMKVCMHTPTSGLLLSTNLL